MFADVKVRHVRDVEKVLRSQLRRLVPGDVPLSDAPAMWDAFDAIERCATAAKTLLAERVGDSRVWARAGDRSAQEYLARQSGSSVGVARCALETSKRLRALPTTEAAVRRGELSREQAQTIADAAAVNPAAEWSLLEAAKNSTLVDLREKASRAKAAGDPDPESTHRRIHRQRCLRRFTDAEGAWNLQGRGTPDAGAVFNAALDPIVDEMFRVARREGRRESRDAHAFDAVMELVRRACGSTHPDAAVVRSPSTGDDAASDDPAREVPASDPRAPAGRTRAPNPNFLALLRVDLQALVRGRAKDDELCEIKGVGPVPVRVARNLLGDSILKLVLTRGVDVANVTHLGRGPTEAQRIALLWSAPACTNSLCSHTLQIQHDHRTPWVEIHETTLDNLDRLCGPCHRHKTHDGWALVEGRGRRPFVPPDDPRHPNKRAASPRGDLTVFDACAAR